VQLLRWVIPFSSGRGAKLLFAAGLLFCVVSPRAQAFALLGPFADWMSISNGCKLPGDVGGAMDINEEYRWNVPVVTYGFEQSFLDYFGSNGVAAVESAVQILNDLPPASDVVLADFPLAEKRFNFYAQAQHLFDLKSAALTLLLEQMGLAPAGRHVFDLRRFDPVFLSQADEFSWPTDAIPNLIVERNFDPEMLLPSHAVNENLYTAFVGVSFAYGDWAVTERTTDPLATYDSAVSDARKADPGPGGYWDSPLREYLGSFDPALTRDDVGGLRYLLSATNINLETLLPDVRGAGTNLNSFVNLALRGGIEKVSFVRHPLGTNGSFGSFTNAYVDTYFTNGEPREQTLERVVTQPDILFAAADFEPRAAAHGYSRSGTSNWWNGSTDSAATNQNGPGVIRPPIVIGFEKRGTHVFTIDGSLQDLNDFRWASYDDSPAAPTVYPVSAAGNPDSVLTVHVHFSNASGFDARHDMHASVPFGSEAVLETSADLTNWNPVQYMDPVSNDGAPISWDIWCTATRMFFRVRAI
jgi:hypothetical protein